MYWDRHLPFAIEAFWYAAASPEIIGEMRRIQASFLEFFGLTAEEVPLLQYSCSQNDPPTNREDRTHVCWTDVS